MNSSTYHNLPPGFQLVATLGQGGEGTVYKAIQTKTEQQYVVKVFHKPLPKAWAVGLQVYAANIEANDFQLLPIKLWETEENIRGVYYPFIRLFRIHRYLINNSQQIAQTIVGSYCRMQHYLISQHGIGLLEPSADHLMLARNGRFSYVDFGYGISTLNHPESNKLNLFGFGLAAFLPSLFNQNLRLSVRPCAGHNFNEPCVYFKDPLFDKLSVRHKWIEPIVSKVRCSPASLLLDSEFYRQLSLELPSQFTLPQLVISANHLLYLLDRYHKKVRQFLFK